MECSFLIWNPSIPPRGGVVGAFRNGLRFLVWMCGLAMTLAQSPPSLGASVALEGQAATSLILKKVDALPIREVESEGPARSAPSKMAQAEGTIRASSPPKMDGAVRVISLAQAFKLAQDQNLDVAMAQSRLKQTRLLKGRVLAALQPYVVAGATYTRNSTEATLNLGPAITAYTDYQLYALGFEPQPIPDEGELGALKSFLEEDIIIVPFDSVTGHVSATWPILSARTIPLWRQANAAIRAGEQTTTWVTREILHGVAQAYYGLYMLQEAVAIQEVQLASQESHLKLATIRKRAGTLASRDVLRAEVEVVQARRQLREAEQLVRNMAADFSVALGLNEVAIRVAPPPEASSPLSGDVDTLFEQARDSRPDLLAAAAQEAAAQSGLSDSRAEFLPSVSLQGSYRYNNAAGFSGQYGTWVVGATADIPIWDGGLRVLNVKDNRQKLIQARQGKRKLELQVRKDIVVALDGVMQSAVDLSTARQELALARRNLEQVETLFEAGSITSLEMRDTETLVLSAERNLLSKRLNRELAALALKQAVGLAP